MLNLKPKSHNEDLISIVLTIDENYVQHCAVTITSLCAHIPKAMIAITIVHNGLTNRSLTKLNKYLENIVNNIYFIKIDEDLLRDAPLSHHISLATYYRILLPEVLDKNIDKILFLDSDIIIRQSVASLWETDISQFSHGAAIEYGIDKFHLESLGMEESSPYFNAGIMLINLKYWRENDISRKAIKYISENIDQIKFWDQDVLNHLLESKWMVLNSQWNATEIVFKPSFWEDRSFGMDLCDELNKARENPSIVHFTGSVKPWHYYHIHPYKKEYYYYLKKTPWKRFTPIGKTSIKQKILSKVKKIFKLLR